MMLRGAGYDVDEASDGEAGSGMGAAGAYDVVITDLRMGERDGIDVLRRIKKDESLKAIPVIVLSTSSAPADLRKAYQNGAGSYLVKPVGFDRFMKLMETFGFYWLEWNQFPE